MNPKQRILDFIGSIVAKETPEPGRWSRKRRRSRVGPGRGYTVAEHNKVRARARRKAARASRQKNRRIAA